jgi:flagellar FliL protein
MVRRNDGKIAIIIVVVVLLVVCSVAGVAVLKKKGHAGSPKSNVPEGPVTMVTIGELIVNLADSSQTRYAKLDVVLEVRGKIEAAGGEGGDSAAANAPLRDAIITIISGKRFAELNRPGGKEALKAQIMAACGKHFKEARVTSVYFNEFAMQ